jgi:hypothetical protein
MFNFFMFSILAVPCYPALSADARSSATGFRLPLRIDSAARGTLRHVAAIVDMVVSGARR